MFVYIFYRGVETRDDSEDLRALIESGLVTAALFLSRGELILALEVSDENQARAIQTILEEVVYGRPEFTLASDSGNLAIVQLWSVPDLAICVALFVSDDLDASEIARRIVADNRSAAVDIVRIVGADNPSTGALAQFTGHERAEIMLQLSKAIAASSARPAIFSFSPTAEEKARRSARRRIYDNPNDVSESSDILPSVQRIAERRGISAGEAIRAAGQTLDWIDSQVAGGGRFLLMKNRKRYRINFPQ